jgi:adenylate cyclase
VQFTNFSKGLSPFILVDFLNTLFTKFDFNAKKFGIEKIKTIGDGYMAAGGVTGDLTFDENRNEFKLNN